MKMAHTKLIKVDNWGIYFLQRLKNFFNRTDYCDLTLQFQDKAQLKVHRLVLSACTEYFEVLERTCEMYEDYLVMPDDLQADVVVPIINFMYTGQLEFSMDILERLYQTSLIMNMPILTKLLNSHRVQTQTLYKSKSNQHTFNDNLTPKKYIKRVEKPKIRKPLNNPTVSLSNKRSYTKAFNKYNANEDTVIYKTSNKPDIVNNFYSAQTSTNSQQSSTNKITRYDPRPTRCELPEELDTDNIFDDSFSNISYASQPLMVHPETVKRYSNTQSSNQTKTLRKDTTTLDIVECRKLPNDSIFEDNETMNDVDMYSSSYMRRGEKANDSSQLFDQIIEQNEGSKVEMKNTKKSSNLDHAKIISDVLKKYPHLVKSNKNIKLKILSAPKFKKESQMDDINKAVKVKTEKPDEGFTYESDVIDSMQAAKLIAMGAENIKGPWICLICGTPGKALHFTSYFKFRRHLVNVHKEKPVPSICEYCGLKTPKRNYMVHHMYSQHGIPPPPPYKFPKCNQCNYIALTEALLIKHKMTHSEHKRFRCTVCTKSYTSSQELLTHIQATGHKYSTDKKANLQCVYCLKVFLRDYNLSAHLKTHHRQEAKEDDILEDSEDEQLEEKSKVRENKITIKYEEPSNSQSEYELQYEIQENPEGSIEIFSKTAQVTQKQKILNSSLANQKETSISIPQLSSVGEDEHETEEIVIIDNIEYIVKNDQLIPKHSKETSKDNFFTSNMLVQNSDQNTESVVPTSSTKNSNINRANIEQNTQSQRVIINKQATINHPIQIVVSNEEEYKALISGNHPIIFDNSNQNKALAVLTTPNSTTLGTTTINMNNTPTNDGVMIIPENYPLNVSDAVAANNSNIVVVYSHPVDNQTKQYQLVSSSPGLEAQFIQSQAIISQNYDVVTTSTDVISSHVLDTQENWQNNAHETIIEQEQQAQVDITTIDNPVEPKASSTGDENDIQLVELPEVALSQETAEAMVGPFTVEETIVNSSPSDDNVDVTIQKTVEEPNLIVPLESDQLAETSINKDLEPSNVAKNEKIIVNEHDNETLETATQSNTNIDKVPNSDVEIQQDEVNPSPHQECLNESETTEHNDNVLVEELQSVEAEEPTQEITYVTSPTYTQEEAILTDSISQDAQEITDITASSVMNVAEVEITNKNIETLTSDWSEDEYDVVNENKTEKCPENENEGVISEAPVEIEESIENIQQEVNNTRVLSVPENIEEDIISHNELMSEVEDIKSIESSKMDVSQDEPQSKISSLLNDWEDNDSQEENTSANEANEENGHGQVVKKEGTANFDKCTDDTVSKSNNESQEPKPPDANIKSLVSDWDEDDE